MYSFIPWFLGSAVSQFLLNAGTQETNQMVLGCPEAPRQRQGWETAGGDTRGDTRGDTLEPRWVLSEHPQGLSNQKEKEARQKKEDQEKRN